MEANKIRLLEFIGTTKKTFNIPVYQRNYDWKAEHCTRLFKDIEHIALQNCEIEHFIGTVVYVVSRTQPTYQELILIDGQQRITSVTLLLKALWGAIEDEEVKADIEETYLINKRAPEELRIKLKPIESDSGPYENIIRNTPDDSDSNITRNYKLFKRLIANSPVLPERLYEALSNVELVYIQLEKDKPSENPQLIFESINSTGLSLTQGDLIRNFLLMNHPCAEQTRLYKNYWLKIENQLTNTNISDFVRDYLTMKLSTIPAKDKVYLAFKTYASETASNMDEERLLDDLLTYAHYYGWFLFCNSDNDDINDCLIQIQQLKSTTVYPGMLSIFEDCFEYKKLNVAELCNVLNLIISYIFRRIICGYPTNALNKVFAALCSDMEKSSAKSTYDKVLDVLTSKTATGTFPRNEEFRNQFIVKDLYKTKFALYTLIRLESFKSKEMIDLTQDITVEHIMPQKLTPTWQIELGNKYMEIKAEYLHTVGNLTLTGYNSNLSNKSFSDKKRILSKSNVAISRNLDKYDTWGKDGIEQRAGELFATAKLIWSLPDGYDENLNAQHIDYETAYSIMDDISVTGEKPRQLVILDMEYTVGSWKAVLRKMCDVLYDLDSSMFRGFILHKDFKGRERNIISEIEDGMHSPYCIADNLFIETNLSANSIINYCRIITEHFGLQDDILFLLRG